MSRPVKVAAFLRRLDELAYEQLCAEAARLIQENERLRDELHWAEDCAESWRDDALRLMEAQCAATGAAPGLTQSGHLVLVQPEART